MRLGQEQVQTPPEDIGYSIIVDVIDTPLDVEMPLRQPVILPDFGSMPEAVYTEPEQPFPWWLLLILGAGIAAATYRKR